MRTRRKFLLSIVTALGLTALAATAAAAQPYGAGNGPGYGPGFMMGPGMMGPGNGGPGMMGGRGGLCSPGMAGFAEWRADRLQALLDLNDTQKKAFEVFREATRNAASAMRASCPTEFPKTAPERMAMMETRMETMLTTVKTVRPALDAFYATLSEQQKAKLDNSRGRGRYWRWRQTW